MLRNLNGFTRAIIIGSVLTASICLFAVTPVARAGTLSSTYMQLSRMQASQAASLRLVFKTSAATQTSLAHITISLPSYTVNSTQTASSAACATPTGTTALPGTLLASGTGTSITITGITAASMASNTAYCVDLTSTSAVTNPAAGLSTATVTTQTATPTTIDTTTVGLDSISNDNYTVTATVPPSFQMTLGGSTDTFPLALNPATPRASTGQTAQFITNASKGWIAWVEDDNPAGMTSPTAGHTIPTVAIGSVTNLVTAQATTEQYGLTAAVTTNGSGSAAIDTQYQGSTTAPIKGGGLSATTFLRFALATGVTNGDTITLNEVANAIATTPAAPDYTDTIFVIGAGSF